MHCSQPEAPHVHALPIFDTALLAAVTAGTAQFAALCAEVRAVAESLATTDHRGRRNWGWAATGGGWSTVGCRRCARPAASRTPRASGTSPPADTRDRAQIGDAAALDVQIQPDRVVVAARGQSVATVLVIETSGNRYQVRFDP